MAPSRDQVCFCGCTVLNLPCLPWAAPSRATPAACCTTTHRHLPPGSWQAAPAWGWLLIPCRLLAGSVEAWILWAYARRLLDSDLSAAAAAGGGAVGGVAARRRRGG